MSPAVRIEGGERREAAAPGEAACRRCGRCCQEKLMVRGRIYLLPVWCRYLDRETMLCTIYERRHELNPECLDVAVGRRLHVFPADCPYVRDLPDYEPPVEDVVDQELFDAIERGEIRSDEEFERRVAEKLKARRAPGR
jgi:uncharacterized cysteine cluster protein YcgN (CxxCxxCC family)